MLKKIKNTLLSMLLPLLFLIGWEFFALRLDNAAVLPRATTVLRNLINPFESFIGLGTLSRNLMYSMARLLLGYFVAISLAIPLGLLMGYFPKFRLIFENFINLFKPVPPIAWQPLVLGWFGISSFATLLNLEYGQTYVTVDNIKLSMVFIIGLGAFFPIILNTMFGVLNVPLRWIESSLVLGANQRDLFSKILLPAAGPNIVNGLRMGLNTAWVSLVSAEMLPGSMAGIGYFITHSYELTRIDLVITGMIVIGFAGWLMDYGFRIVIKKHFSWSNR